MTAPGDVTWVDSGGQPPPAPQGAAPRLLGSRRRAGRWPPRVFDVLAGLGVLLTLACIVVAAGAAAVRERRDLGRLVADGRAALDGHGIEAVRAASRARRGHEAAVAARVRAALNAREAAIIATCEGGTWCSERLAALAPLVHAADALASEAQDADAAWRGPSAEFLWSDLAALDAELAALHAGGAAEARARTVSAERAALAAHAGEAAGAP